MAVSKVGSAGNVLFDDDKDVLLSCLCGGSYGESKKLFVLHI